MKVWHWILIALVVWGVTAWFLYDRYIKKSWYYQKKILALDEEFKHFLWDEFDSRASAIDIANNVETYSKGFNKFILNSGKDNMDYNTVKMYDDAREIIEQEWNSKNTFDKIYFIINSGYRSVGRNDEVGGVKNSAHLKGKGADISWSGYSQKKKNIIKDALERVGFKRFGIANTFIHADNDSSLLTPATWSY